MTFLDACSWLLEDAQLFEHLAGPIPVLFWGDAHVLEPPKS